MNNKKIRLQVILSPEGLTPSQEKLAEMLFDSKTVAPVGRRRILPGGKYELYKFERPTSTIDFPQNNEEFALKHHENMPDAPLSPIYINLRNLPDDVLDQVGIVMAEISTEKKPDFCVGIPKAGTPLADSYSEHTGIKTIDIFEKIETTTGRMIIARKNANSIGKTIRIIDDLATKGDTKIEALKAAEKMGYVILDLVVLVDREQGAEELIKKAGFILRSAFTFDQLLRFGVRTKRLNKEKYVEIKTYLAT